MPAPTAFKDPIGRLGPPRSLRVRVPRRRLVEQRLHHPPALLDAILAREALAIADQRRVQQNLVGSRALPALRRKFHVHRDLLWLDGLVTLSLYEHLDPGRRIELDPHLTRLRKARPAGEVELWGTPKDDAKI